MEIQKQYRIIEHEADIGFEVYGKTLEEIYRNAAEALFSLIINFKDQVPSEKGKLIDLKDGDVLLISFLNELLYLWDTEGFIPKEFSLKVNENRVTGNVIGGIFDPVRDVIVREVKAVTYHAFSISNEDDIYKARFIIDI